MDAWIVHERIAACGDLRVTQFLDVMERGERTLKLVLKLTPRVGRSVSLHEKNLQNGHGRNNEAHRDEQFPAEARHAAVRLRQARRGDHGKLTWSVPVLGTSTGCSRVVWLSTQALSV